MTETTGLKGSVPKRGTTSRGLLAVTATLLLMLGGLLGGYLYGRELARRALENATELIQQLQPENRRLLAHVNILNEQIASLQAKLKKTETAMHAMSPAENTYNVSPNQAIIAAGGRVILGMVGVPRNRSVVININGKQHTAVSGDVFEIAPDPSTSCQVRLLSFDMFSALLSAICKEKTQ